MSEDAARKLLGVTWSDAEFFGEEALASIGKDEVNARDSRVRIEERQRFLGEDGAAGSGHTYGNGLSLGFSHNVRG